VGRESRLPPATAMVRFHQLPSDAVIHFDETCAVEPLEQDQPWQHSAAPETFPSGV
jgi:hypothetical protein